MDVASKRRELEDTGVLREYNLVNFPAAWESNLTGNKRRRSQEEPLGDADVPEEDTLQDPWGVQTGDNAGKLASEEQVRPPQGNNSREQQEEANPETPVDEAHTQPTISGEGSSTYGHLAVSYGNRAARARVGIG